MDKRLLRSSVWSLVVVLAGHCAFTSSPAGTVFFEDFDDGAAQGFVEVGGAWSVVDGKYVQTTTNPPGPYRSYVNALQEYIIDVDFTILSGQEAKVIYAHGDAGENYRVDFWQTASRLTMPVWGQGWVTREFVSVVSLSYNTEYHAHVEVNLSGVRVWLNRVVIHDRPWANGEPLGDGYVGVGTWSATARFDNFVVRDMSETVSLFSEDFDDARANRFTEVGDSWDVDNGTYLQFAETPVGPYRSWVAALSRYVIEATFTPLSGAETKIIYAHADTEEEYRVDFWLDQSRLCIPVWGEGWSTRNTTLGGLDLSYHRTYRVRVEVNHAGVKVWLNNKLRHDEPWANGWPLGDGKVGVGTFTASSSFNKIAVHALTATPGKTWYVDHSVTQSGDGTTWHTAFKKIQEGIDAASHGDTVIVAAGTYYENAHFLAKSITLRSTDPLDPAVVNATIINGRAQGPVVTCQGDESENCVLSGFTITNGKSPYGGGVMGHHARPTIRHNIIFDNWGDDGGGLAFCHGPIESNTVRDNRAIGSYPAGSGGGLYECNGRIQDNIIMSNTADRQGGGLSECNGDIRDNVITGNSTAYGGGLEGCDGPIVNNEISFNSCTINGAGVMRCDGQIRGNFIQGNTAVESGGGLAYCGGPITGNTIIENSCKWGGGLEWCDGPIRNNIVAGNVATLAGGGLGSCDAPIENNVIVGNSTQNGGGLCNCSTTVINCIIWGNEGKPGLGPQIWDSSGNTELLNCTVQGGWTGAGAGNIALDPQFLDADGADNDPDTFADNDYRLKATSPCIDTGLNQPWMWGAVDLDGNNRIFFGGKSKNVDMGAYEYGSFRFTTVNIERLPSGQLKLTWTSRPGDTYDIFSTSGLPSQFWFYGGSVASQGELTTWSGGSTAPSSGVFKVGIQ